MSRQMAHSYYDELYDAPEVLEHEPIIGSWADVGWIFVQTAACLFVMVALLAGVYLMGMGVEGPR